MSDASDDESSNTKDDGFTVDNTNTSLVEMPSVTKLLNRKSLTKLYGDKPGNSTLEVKKRLAAVAPPHAEEIETPGISLADDNENEPTQPKVELVNTLDFANGDEKPSTVDSSALTNSSDFPPPFDKAELTASSQLKAAAAAEPPRPAPTPAPVPAAAPRAPAPTPVLAAHQTAPVQTAPAIKPAPAAAAKTAPANAQQPAVRPATRKRKALYLWTKELLSKATDPFHKGVFYLINNGASAAALLTPNKGSSLSLVAKPQETGASFITSYAYVTPTQGELWRGLSINEEMLPDVWQIIAQAGFAEFNPNSHGQAGQESHYFLRKAFNLKQQEWLILVRCGSQQACTGILALVSNGSITPHIMKAFSAVAKAA